MSSKVSSPMVVIKFCYFFEVKRSRMSNNGEHYLVLSSLKHIDMMQKCEKALGNWDWTLMLRMWILYHCTASYQRRYHVGSPLPKESACTHDPSLRVHECQKNHLVCTFVHVIQICVRGWSVPWAAFRPLLIFDQISLLESLLQFTSKPFADVSPLQFVSKVSWGGYQQGQAHPG